jgi:hypothetical protein
VIVKSFALRLVGMVALATCAWTAPVRAQSCAGDADCESPLTCKSPGTICSQGATRLPDGGVYVSDPVCEARPSECVWVFVACQDDSECTLPDWGCMTIPGQTTVKTCFPKYITCSPAEPCPTGWLCIDSARVYHNDPLEVWGLESGGPNYCWPSSLGGALTGSTRTDSSGLGLPTPDGGLGVDKGDGGATISLDAPSMGADAGTQVTPTADSGVTISVGSDASRMGPDAGVQVPPTTDSASASNGSGCTIAGQSTSGRSALFALALVGLLCLRRSARKE